MPQFGPVRPQTGCDSRNQGINVPGVAMRIVKSLILAFILLFAACLENARACAVPHRRTFPACEISAPRSDERTTIIYVNSGSALSSVTPGSDAIVTEVVDIEIGIADKPHYIVLSSGKPIIWRFAGRIDAISRVVVLGSQFNGATRSGVTGVPPDRILFAKADMETLKQRMPQSTCDSVYAACEASAYFDIPKAARMQLAGDAPSERYGVDQFVERLRGDVIRIPQDGWVEAGERGRWQTETNGWPALIKFGPFGRYEPFGGSAYIETSQNYERGLIKVDATSIVSQETVRDYSVLPAAEGIRQLLADGSLVGPDDARFRAAYDKWNERLSRPYRGKLGGRNFLFSYTVNYLTTRPMTLPAALDGVVLLVGEGVEAPDMNGNGGHHGACFFYADVREVHVHTWICDGGFSNSFVLSESERSLAMKARSLDRMQQAGQADKDK
jgi:hypothetical protein